MTVNYCDACEKPIKLVIWDAKSTKPPFPWGYICPECYKNNPEDFELGEMMVRVDLESQDWKYVHISPTNSRR